MKFALGETKYVDFKIRSTINEPVIILSANWELEHNGEVVDRGVCEINGDMISVLLTPPNYGNYILTAIYEVAPETKKARCVVEVD